MSAAAAALGRHHCYLVSLPIDPCTSGWLAMSAEPGSIRNIKKERKRRNILVDFLVGIPYPPLCAVDNVSELVHRLACVVFSPHY